MCDNNLWVGLFVDGPKENLGYFKFAGLLGINSMGYYCLVLNN